MSLFGTNRSVGHLCRTDVRDILSNDRPEHPATVRIVISVRDNLFRTGIQAILRGPSGFEVVGEAEDPALILAAVQKQRPDLLLLEWDLARREDMRVIKDLTADGSAVHIVLLSVPPDHPEIARMIQLGVRAILPHEATADSLRNSILQVMDGHYVLGDAGVESLVGALREPRQTGFQNARRKFGITHREFDVVMAIVSGYSNLEIAERLSLSSHTVKHHMTHIFDKLGVSNRLELALFAVNHRFVSKDQ